MVKVLVLTILTLATCVANRVVEGSGLTETARTDTHIAILHAMVLAHSYVEYKVRVALNGIAKVSKEATQWLKTR